MANFDLQRFTGFTYTFLALSLLLLSSSIALLVLASRILHAFRDEQIQYPGSSLAEWLFVSMKPGNLDRGPTTGIFVAGASGVFCGVAGVLWIVALWWGFITSRRIARCSLAMAVLNCMNNIAGLAILVYVSISEAKNALPEHFSEWRQTTFTREFYLCTAFPSVFNDADALFGFHACDVASAARYTLIGVFCVSALMAGLAVLQAHRAGAFVGSQAQQQNVVKEVPSPYSYLDTHGTWKPVRLSRDVSTPM